MKQGKLIESLQIHLSDRQIKNHRCSHYRLKKEVFCPRINKYLKESNTELISQLSDLINEGDIDLMKIRQMGFLTTVKGGMCPSQNATSFEMQLLRNFPMKEQAIENLLTAINMIDYSTMMAV